MTYNECRAIVELDLDPIKVKLMHEESGEGWSIEQANAVEAEYRRFLYLMKTFPHEAAAPLMDVDIFWHYHILDTMKYARDCEEVFGYFLHHFPYVGLRGEDDLAAHERMGERMRDLYEETFGEKYRLQEAGAEAAAAAFSSAPGIAFSSAPGQAASDKEQHTAFSSAPAIAFSSAPAQPGSDKALRTAFSSAPGIAFSSAPAQPGSDKALRTAFSSAPGIAFSSAPGHTASEKTLRTAFSSAPGIAFSSAPGKPAGDTTIPTAFSSAPGIAFSSAPGRAAGDAHSGTKKLGPAMAEFFSIRPRLESSALA